MFALLCLLLQSPAPPVTPPATASQLSQRGELLRRTNEGLEPVDSFELVQFVPAGAGPVRFVIMQSGTDRTPWQASFGERPACRPLVPHMHDGVLYRIEPLVDRISHNLQDGAIWNEGRQAFRIGDAVRHEGIAAREVFVTDGPARNHRLLVDEQTRMPVSVEQRVFMGQGDEYRLLIETRPAEGDANPRDAQLMDRLMQLRSSLAIDEKKPWKPLSAEQLTAVQAALPELRPLAESTWAARFVTRIETETQAGMNRTQKLAGLNHDVVGKPLPRLPATLIDGTPLDASQMAGHVVVMHFWKYRDKPLSDPYGQTGYLDFLKNGFQGKPVRVVGVNVDSRYAARSQATAANRSARKLTDFMNLSYPIATDDGTLLKQLGDPRAAGGNLPLWIVVDRAGTVRAWKSGYYDVDPRHGLKELRSTVEALLE